MPKRHIAWTDRGHGISTPTEREVPEDYQRQHQLGQVTELGQLEKLVMYNPGHGGFVRAKDLKVIE